MSERMYETVDKGCWEESEWSFVMYPGEHAHGP
jgi:hypothetical protein